MHTILRATMVRCCSINGVARSGGVPICTFGQLLLVHVAFPDQSHLPGERVRGLCRASLATPSSTPSLHQSPAGVAAVDAMETDADDDLILETPEVL